MNFYWTYLFIAQLLALNSGPGLDLLMAIILFLFIYADRKKW
jgi:hypothetical protein